MNSLTKPLILLGLSSLASQGAVIALAGDEANTTTVLSSQGTKAEQLAALSSDEFAYDPADPTSATPSLSGGWFHGASSGVWDVIALDFNSTYDNLFIDIWGRDGNPSVEGRDDNFDVLFYLGGVIQETINSGIGSGDNFYTRVIASAGTQADSIRIVDKKSEDNAFTLTEIRVNTTAVPEPSSTALLGLGGLALILRRRK